MEYKAKIVSNVDFEALLRVVRAAGEMVSDYHNGETNRYPIMDELREALEALPEHLRNE